MAARMPNADAPRCAYPGCLNNAWIENEVFHRCCGRTHARELRVVELTAQQIADDHDLWPDQDSLDELARDLVLAASINVGGATSSPPSLPTSFASKFK